MRFKNGRGGQHRGHPERLGPEQLHHRGRSTGPRAASTSNYERLNKLQCVLRRRPRRQTGLSRPSTHGPAHFHGEVTWNIPGMNIGYGELKSIETYEFIKAVVEGKRPSTSFAEGYRVERVCDAVKRSAETGRWEKVAD